ncbi:unnamed protein product [Brassica napus]|nr:unnamed protein product [Brassica napus]
MFFNLTLSLMKLGLSTPHSSQCWIKKQDPPVTEPQQIYGIKIINLEYQPIYLFNYVKLQNMRSWLYLTSTNAMKTHVVTSPLPKISHLRSLHVPYLLHLRESKVMKHSQAVLLLSSDFGTAWNARKLILPKQNQPLEAFTKELHLSRLILSKSEPKWSHRTWIIKMLSRSSSTPQEIVTKESELVESIGEVLQELNKSKRWAGLHVADSSCFHYRRRLMLRVLEPLKVKGSNANDKFDAHKTLMLSETGESIFTNEETGIFIGNEIHLLESSMTVLDNKFEDFRAQALHASVYMLWLTKHIPEVWSMLEEKLGTEKLKCVLSTVDQERPLLAFAPN